MKPPNISTPPPDQPNISTQQAQPTSDSVSDASITNTISSQPVIATPQTTTTQVQQAPLALITQPQTQIKPQISNPQLQTTSTIQSQSQHLQIPQLQSKIQPPQIQPSITQPDQPIPMTKTPALTGQTALVIIPQHSTSTPANHITTPAKIATLSAKQTPITTTVGNTTAHVTLTTANQSTAIQLQASPITTNMTNIITVPITAHQQSNTVVQPALANRPPSTLPIVPITASLAPVKSEPNKYICCLLDNGVRCERVAGNASFSARIQKIVGTKKMNFVLDPTVRHAYICEDHKQIITVAKKSTTLARDTKSNAKNYTANNNVNTLAPQPDISFSDFSTPQQTLQHPVSLDLINNQNRLSNNHTGALNNMPIRQGTQIAYSIYQGAHSNQVGFDNVGGDDVPSSSSGIDVDLQQLQVNTLRRYKRHFRVQTRPGLNKLQLAESLKGHFRTLPIIEKEAITYFVYIVKCYRNKLDHNPKAD